MKGSILVAESDAAQREWITASLDRIGFDTRIAGSGSEALACLQEQPPDVVLTDLEMPEMNGIDLVREVGVRRPSLPVVLMTGRGSEETATMALRAGAASYIPKSLIDRHLGGVLSVVLERAAFRRELDGILRFADGLSSHFTFGYEADAQRAFIRYYQHAVMGLGYPDEVGLHGLGTAISEALTNAVERGNLELESRLRELDGREYYELRAERLRTVPYTDRRVRVSLDGRPGEIVCEIQNEGPGFDLGLLPPEDEVPELDRATGRGIFLMRTLMDEVSFGDEGRRVTLVKRW